MVTGLKERFPSASAKVLSAFDIFSLETLPSDQGTWNQKRESYGDQDLSTLVNHYFPATADIEDECKRTRVHAQWRTLRERMWEFKLKLTAEARNSTSNFWADFLNTPPPTPCEDVRELVEIFLVKEVINMFNNLKVIEVFKFFQIGPQIYLKIQNMFLFFPM